MNVIKVYILTVYLFIIDLNTNSLVQRGTKIYMSHKNHRIFVLDGLLSGSTNRGKGFS